MMEAGDRKMIAAEVAALAHILDTTVADLFTPPAEAETVSAGSLMLPAEALAAPVGGTRTRQRWRMIYGRSIGRGRNPHRGASAGGTPGKRENGTAWRRSC